MPNKKAKKYREVKYYKHGVLRKTSYLEKEIWIFETQGEVMEFQDAEITDILDDLSIEGYELICHGDEGYIFKTKREVEETLEYFETS